MESFDIVIVGAGISGIGCAYYLSKNFPNKKIVILERQSHYGGTWWTHQYPGIRADTDLYTFGYSFKPWMGNPIAKGSEILSYLGEVIQENDLEQRIRYNHQVTGCHYSSTDHQWSINIENTSNGLVMKDIQVIKSSFLLMCHGYYDHEHPFVPEWPTLNCFKGQIIHPQKWPVKQDTHEAETEFLRNKKVVVLGLGATCATLVPSITSFCNHITVIQRSPTYLAVGTKLEEFAEKLKSLENSENDESWIHDVMRRRCIYQQSQFYNACIHNSEPTKEMLVQVVRSLLPENYDVTKHFEPTFAPFKKRVCLVPDGDFLQAISFGKVSMVTDEIEEFTSNGVRIKSNQEVIPADIIITATGFQFCLMGNIPFTVDGQPVDWRNHFTYRGMMLSGIPNLVIAFGYFRFAWTLKVELCAKFFCNVLKHMDETNLKEFQVNLTEEDQQMDVLPLFDAECATYLERDKLLPKRGTKYHWTVPQDYIKDCEDFAAITLDDPIFQFH